MAEHETAIHDVDFTDWTARELGAAVTPLFTLPGRVQQAALNELVIRCEIADRLARGCVGSTAKEASQ